MRPVTVAAVLAITLSGSIQASDTVAVIESVDPSLPAGVSVDIVGADSPMRIRGVGHSIEVPGYENEPYLRIDLDGSAYINDASVTAAVNEERYGSDPGPRLPSDTPEWRRTQPDGTVMWHDHRVHWMSRSDPPVRDDKGSVLEFAVPIVVDGTTHTVKGTLYLRPNASWGWWLGVPVALAAFVLLRRRSGILGAVSCGLVLMGVIVGAAQWTSLPVGARVTPVLAGFSLLAAVLVAVSLVPVVRRSADTAAAIVAGAGTSLVVGAVLCGEQVRSAWVPGTDVQARVMVPVLLGWGVAMTVDAVMSILRPRTTSNA